MKLRDTVILVVLAHVGLVLIWICMGGCANDKADDKVAVVGPEAVEEEVMPATTEMTMPELATPITVESTEVVLPTIPEPTVTPAPVTEEAASAEEIKIVVKKGDTLWALSRKYGVPVSAIVDRNDIQDAAMIREGRELIIPVGATPVETPEPEATLPVTAAEGSTSALPAGSEAVPVAEDGETMLHTVEAGDTIWILARKYSSTSARIMEANNITDATKLQIGQELRIPKGE
ncbi:LysM peptidoglycan-binding domain-containing protein [bacterium]|nr:LysM peptidoglycan-binding domain-containing protein [bacterium]